MGRKNYRMLLLGASVVNIDLAITFASAPGIMRIVRGLTLDLRQRDYVAAAQLRGESTLHIMLVEILPNALGAAHRRCVSTPWLCNNHDRRTRLPRPWPAASTPDWGGMINETGPWRRYSVDGAVSVSGDLLARTGAASPG